MNLNLSVQIFVTTVLLAGLQACGSGSVGTEQAAEQPVVPSAKLNFIDTNKNGVKDADEVYDANHNGIDDATECLAGDDDHNGRIEGAEKNYNDANHNGSDDDNDADYKGAKGQCKSVGDGKDDGKKGDDKKGDDDKGDDKKGDDKKNDDKKESK
jgi:hypothetical protein